MPPTEHAVELRVRYAETDQMGVVYHANYLVWCEIGRTEMMRALGAPYAEVERHGTVLAVSDASLRFHASARYDDRIRVTTRLGAVRSRLVEFVYDIARVTDGGVTERLVSARTSLVALDENGRPRTLPASLLGLFRDAIADA
jgi:acyl-CoA thioester hydrolase